MLVLVLATFTICAAQTPTNPGTYRGFDPQPEPPRWHYTTTTPRVKKGFDPQPDPPGARQGLNPQPLPPGTIQGLNPQPLPPKSWSHSSSPPGYYTK